MLDWKIVQFITQNETDRISYFNRTFGTIPSGYSEILRYFISELRNQKALAPTIISIRKMELVYILPLC